MNIQHVIFQVTIYLLEIWALDNVITYDNIIAMKTDDQLNWKITFYNEKVKNQIRSFPIGIQTNLTYILELIMKLGPNLGRPHTAPLGKGLFEIRAKR